MHQAHSKKILLDDRDLRQGEKFVDAELMGIPYRVVISDKTLEDQAVEITERKTGKSKVVSIEEFKKMLKK